ncbi:MAG: MBL fold metallo-hydrolase, partial [Proteobacteria bacterium]|nr:MBL fold metallo-hydrolase [Pseudomonadota bacterium]
MKHYSNILVSSVLGNSQLLDGGAMFGNAPRALWQRWAEPDDLGRIPLACRSMLLELDGTKVLCETGIGAYMPPDLADRYGRVETKHQLLINLKSQGFLPEDIDYVILSHLHFDHAGGLLAAYGEPSGLAFPRAKIVLGKEAWQRACHPHARDRASFIPGLTDLIANSGRLCLVEGSCLPDFPEEQLSFRYSHGHTPGHMHTLVQGSRSSMFFAGDLIPGKNWVHLPITMGYDRFAEQVIDEKQKLYDEAVAA